MYQHVIIQQRARLSEKRRQLCIETDRAHLVPLEDVDTLTLSNHQSVITTCLLNDLVENGSSVIICGRNHQPTGILMPFGAYSRRLSLIQLQIHLPKPRQKRIWQRIVQQKIKNQGKCLSLAGKKDVVTVLADKVHSGDDKNVEAVAAARYFKELFGQGFIRHDAALANSALDYGYAIIRSSIARFLAVYGFEPCLGIHHHSETNAFNLADDIIEPFRPVVDLYVYTHPSEDVELSKEMKQGLVALLRENIQLGKETVSMDYAIESVVQNLIRCYREKEEQFLLPELRPLSPHRYE